VVELRLQLDAEEAERELVAADDAVAGGAVALVHHGGE
jgi:hypothetical protein